MKSKTAYPAPAGDCTVIDKEYFAHLIRKKRSLKATVFAEDHQEVASCQTGLFSVRVSAKEAVEKLERCDFDAFEWRFTDSGGPALWHYTAPIPMQLRRRRDFLVERIKTTSARLETTVTSDEWNERLRLSRIAEIASDREELGRILAQLIVRTSVAA